MLPSNLSFFFLTKFILLTYFVTVLEFFNAWNLWTRWKMDFVHDMNGKKKETALVS